MKLPELPKRKPAGSASGRSSRVQPPAFLQDLYRDMRDRRLIVPAVALLIAIVAVPAVLSSPAASPATPPSSVADPGAIAVEPAVLATQEVGVRDFRKRLDALHRKDPFGGRFEPENLAGAGLGELADPEDPGAGIPVESGGSPAAPAGGTGMDNPAPGPTAAPQPAAPPEPYVLVPRVDVEVGVVDRDRRQSIEGVKSGEVLPSKQAPAAMFLGNSDDSETSKFLVSRDVSAVNGEGDCRPGENNCDFLTLRDGESAYLRFADGKRYVITVKDIYFVRTEKDQFDEKG